MKKLFLFLAASFMAPIVLSQHAGDGGLGFISSNKECQKKVEDTLYKNYQEAQDLKKELKDFVIAQRGGKFKAFLGFNAKEDMSQLEEAIDVLESTSSGYQPAWVMTSSWNGRVLEGEFPHIQMKDIALKHRMNFGKHDFSAGAIFCAKMAIRGKRGGLTYIDQRKTFEYIAKEIQDHVFAGFDIDTGNVKASSLRLPNSMPADLKRKYAETFERMRKRLLSLKSVV